MGFSAIRTVNHLQGLLLPEVESLLHSYSRCHRTPSLRKITANHHAFTTHPLPAPHPLSWPLYAFMLQSVLCTLCSLNFFGEQHFPGPGSSHATGIAFPWSWYILRCLFPLWKRMNSSHSNYFKQQDQESLPHVQWSSYMLSSKRVTLRNRLPVSSVVGLNPPH